jgi:hypothetical protein
MEKGLGVGIGTPSEGRSEKDPISLSDNFNGFVENPVTYTSS